MKFSTGLVIASFAAISVVAQQHIDRGIPDITDGNDGSQNIVPDGPQDIDFDIPDANDTRGRRIIRKILRRKAGGIQRPEDDYESDHRRYRSRVQDWDNELPIIDDEEEEEDRPGKGGRRRYRTRTQDWNNDIPIIDDEEEDKPGKGDRRRYRSRTQDWNNDIPIIDDEKEDKPGKGGKKYNTQGWNNDLPPAGVRPTRTRTLTLYPKPTLTRTVVVGPPVTVTRIVDVIINKCRDDSPIHTTRYPGGGRPYRTMGINSDIPSADLPEQDINNDIPNADIDFEIPMIK